MDFSQLLKPYAEKDTISKFLEHLNDESVSSLLLNPRLMGISLFPFEKELRQDKYDDRLYRFNKTKARLGKSLEHFAGAFYLLDPSSALISYYLDDLVKPDPLVLDMCAAPGGKSIAFSFRRKDSLIISNDISYTRALEIVKNTDRLGLSNIATMSMDPLKIPSRFDSSFDLILLDAPCSGSGMIRKEEKMKEDWSIDKVERLLPIQADLLEKAYQLLKKDGIICYSTCSLSVEEDENQVEEFLKKHTDIEEIKINIKHKDVLPGKYGYHLIPGVFDGEGIYFSILRKKSGDSYSFKEAKYQGKENGNSLHTVSYKKNTFLINRFYTELESLPFIVIGTKIQDLTEHPKCPYDHSYSKVGDFPTIEITREEAIRYAKGEEIQLVKNDSEDGLKVCRYGDLKLGFGKKVKNKFKNYLPKGLRCELI